MVRLLIFGLIPLFFLQCQTSDYAERNKNDQLFTLLDQDETSVVFNNSLEYSEEINPYTFRSFYNGGGVGLGDFNNDGLIDIFLSGNQVSNKLYLNVGGLKFKDITTEAGLESNGVWSTGISIVDINSDGLLDIYICKSGNPKAVRRKNELFINQGDLTFKEVASEYGLDYIGLSIHASFFDYDKDGDLDCYLLSNSLRAVGIFDYRKDQRNDPDPEGGNKLLMNDNGVFKDVSQESGIYTSKIGFGLGIAVSDINNDDWPDIYVANDFFERDYLYINNRDGTFTEELESRIQEISLGSMGVDIADINNDSHSEIFVSEMLPYDFNRLRTTSQFESWDKYSVSVNNGYHRQFSRNTLQLNNGDETFSEVSRFAGVQATDWSWGALIFDMDNDGWKDIFVANGIYKDLMNQDYVNFVANESSVREMLREGKDVIKKLVDSIPSNKLANYTFRNNHNLTFTDMSNEWGLLQATHSNGSAYGDLDNDGDLDLVLNNVNMPASIYRNNSERVNNGNGSISIELVGSSANRNGIGAKVSVFTEGKVYFQEQSPMRGFMSTVDNRIHIGIGTARMVDSLIIEWPDFKRSRLTSLKPGVYKINEEEAKSVKYIPSITKDSDKAKQTILRESQILKGHFEHRENAYVDFNREKLLYNMISNEGPCLCKGDINNDGLEDFYIGGSKNQAGVLYKQNAKGFVPIILDSGSNNYDSEDIDCVFFDANNDGLDDLYVASGSNEASSSSISLNDRLYFSIGNDRFEQSAQLFPSSLTFESTSTVSVTDFDRDGDLDLFVGSRLVPFNYGVPASSYLLINDGLGKFIDKTELLAPELRGIGLVTDSEWVDINNDGRQDLILVGEWMPITLFMQENGHLVNRTKEYGFEKSNGWYNVVATGDFNKDSKIDIVAGNHGLNSRFKASELDPLKMFVNDFDGNGMIEQIICFTKDGKSYPFALRNDLISQLPSIRKLLVNYSDYVDKGVSDLFSQEVISSSIIHNTYSLASSVYISNDNGFKKLDLPDEAQFSVIYSIAADDFDQDGKVDLILGGNQYRAKPETGIYAASYGLLLKGNGDGTFSSISSKKSGIKISGEVRSSLLLKFNKSNLVLFGRNNDKMKVLSY